MLQHGGLGADQLSLSVCQVANLLDPQRARGEDPGSGVRALTQNKPDQAKAHLFFQVHIAAKPSGKLQTPQAVRGAGGERGSGRVTNALFYMSSDFVVKFCQSQILT